MSRRLFRTAGRPSLRRGLAIESFEQRLLLSFSAALSGGDHATFTGNSLIAAGDTLIFNSSNGLLVHNRSADPGFVSAFDFDSTVAGEQTLTAASTNFVSITPGNGADSIQFGNAFSTFNEPASKLFANFFVDHNANPSAGVGIEVSDTASAVANSFDVAQGSVVATGISVSYGGAAAFSGIAIGGGSAADTFNVVPSSDVSYSIDAEQPASAPGDVLNYNANFANADDDGSQITQAGKQPVHYQGFETVNVFNETADASQLVVKNTNTSGTNSLTNAIINANLIPGPNTITFNIPGSGVQMIPLQGDLVQITDTVTIDGYSQPGSKANTLASGANNAVLKIRIDGAHIGAGTGTGLHFTTGADGSVVRGLMLTNTPGALVVDPIKDVVVAGNFIGTDGVADLGNGTGVSFGATGASRIGGTTPADRNVISGNETNIQLRSVGASVLGNLIGLNAAGTAALQNQTTGIDVTVNLGSNDGNIIGGPTAAHRNVIAGNETGINIAEGADNTRILGNYINTDITGNVGLFGLHGVEQVGNAVGTEIGGIAAGEGNVIAAVTGISSSGISVHLGNVLIRGNLIGTNPAGTAKVGDSRWGVRVTGGVVTVGGSDPGARNIINAGGDAGISSIGAGASLTVRGNYIGTDITGTKKLGNGTGVELESDDADIGGAAPGEGNLISGNFLDGIYLGIDTTTAKVFGNRIGTDITGKLPLGNGRDGVNVLGNQHYIGGFGGSSNDGLGNIIAFNGWNGVTVQSSGDGSGLFTVIYDNSIFSNGLLGIDLGRDGVTANDPLDADTGANALLNKPKLNSAFTNATGVAVTGTLEAAPDVGLFIQFFASPGPDPSGFGEGKLLLGSTLVYANSAGVANFAAEFPVAIPAGQVITATATGFDGTSEFSNAVAVTGTPPRLSIDDVTVTESNGLPVSATFTISMSYPVSGPVKVDFTTADGTAVAQGDYLSQSGSVTFNAGETSRTVTVTINPDSVVEGTETFVVNLSNAEIADIADGQGVGTILDSAVVPPNPPSGNSPYFTISDVEAKEGNSGTKQLVFTVTRNGSTSGPASVKFVTQNQTAGSGDYDAKSGTLNFANGEATKTISITVKGDTKVEGDESFRVILSNATGAVIAGGNGIGKILNDDGNGGNPQPPPPPPSQKSLAISDAQIYEGQSGTKTLNFTVTLSGAASGNVVVKYRTQNQSAGSGDYDAKTGVLTFTPGQTSKTISIVIKGDTKKESDETFRVELFENVNATIQDGTGIGTIKNDD